METSEQVAGPQDECRTGAVSSVECRPGCRDMPLYAAICRSLECKSLIFLGLGFFFASQLRWRSASRAKLAREPESLPARHDLRCRIHPTFVNTPVVALARVPATVVPD